MPTVTLDGLVAATALDASFIEKPRGVRARLAQAVRPRFALADCKIIRADVVGERHVKLIASQGAARINGIAFRAMENGLGPALLGSVGQNVHLAGHIRRDTWQGRDRVQLQIDDGAKSS